MNFIIQIALIVLIVVAVITLIALIVLFRRLGKTLSGVDVVMKELETTVDETNELLGFWTEKSKQMDEPLNNLIEAGERASMSLLSILNIVAKVSATLSLLRFGKKKSKGE